MKLYKEDVAFNITKKEDVEFKTVTNMSDPRQVSLLTGLHMDYCENREVLYIYPKNTSGKHWYRWLSIEKKDIKSLIKTLEKFV